MCKLLARNAYMCMPRGMKVQTKLQNACEILCNSNISTIGRCKKKSQCHSEIGGNKDIDKVH